jgi:hypothetical protein
LAADPATSGGVAAGREPAQAVEPGGSRMFTYYASPEVGQTVALVRDWGNVLANPSVGLYGAIVVGPPGATYRGSGAAVDVFPKEGQPYRDVSLFFQDGDESIGTHRMPYTTEVRGNVGLNYRSAPLSDRVDASPGPGAAFRSEVHGDPSTPIIEAFAGDAVRLHVIAPSSEQAQVFSVEGHEWSIEPGRAGANVVSSQQVGGLEAVTMNLLGGAGGPDHIAGDYVYGDHRGPFLEAGLWGILRVHQRGETVTGLQQLTTNSRGISVVTVIVAFLALLALLVVVVRRRRT